MANPTDTDPRWLLLMRQVRHEVATPISVILGYLRMLERFGPLNDKQRHVVGESLKSGSAITKLLEQIGSLSKFETSGVRLIVTAIDVEQLVKASIESAAAPSGEAGSMIVQNEAPGAAVRGDPQQLQDALTAVLWSLRREVVDATPLIVHVTRVDDHGQRMLRLTIVDEQRIALKETSRSALTRFLEWRGGCGLTLTLARRIIALHGGESFSPVAEPPETESLDRDINVDGASKYGAVILLPEA
jgi:signal transduction histidine kinase